MRPSGTFLIIVIMFFCATTASAQKPLTKPDKPQTQSSTSKYSSGGATKSTTKSATKANFINDHEYVDLGLSVKWATCNVGASSPSDYGNYYAWGETKTKSEYTVENSITYGKNMGNIAGNSTYDVARAKWGGTWRLPTKEEIKELDDKCRREWTNEGGHDGYKIIGPNGNSIFLPAAGMSYGTSYNYVGEEGSYWGATPKEDDTSNAIGFGFDNKCLIRSWDFRCFGQSVRPVSE